MKDATWHLNAEVNVTPFLDVLLVLIIIFLATANTRKTMDVQIPVPCAGSCDGSALPVVLEVLADGSFLLNQRPVEHNALLPTLHGVYDSRPDKIINVLGRRAATYQSVLSAMDVARSAGVKVIAIPPGFID